MVPCENVGLTHGEGGSLLLTASCGDVAGNTANVSQSFKVDLQDPTIAATPDRAPGSSGWHIAPATLHYTCADPGTGSGLPDDACPQDVTVDGEGESIVTRSVADRAGRSASASSIVRVDLQDPTIAATADRAPGAGGWYTAPVTIHYTCADPGNGSGLASGACPQDVTVDTEGVSTTTRSVSDRSGRSITSSSTIKVDLQDPTAIATGDRVPEKNGWYTSPVTVAFTCSDPFPGSGVADCPGPATVASEGDTTISGNAHDVAGRTSAAAVASIHLDAQPPDTRIDRRSNGKADLSGGRLHGSATDAASGVRQVAVTWKRVLLGPLTTYADIVCGDVTRRVCTWSAQLPIGLVKGGSATASDRVDRADPTPDLFSGLQVGL